MHSNIAEASQMLHGPIASVLSFFPQVQTIMIGTKNKTVLGQNGVQ